MLTKSLTNIHNPGKSKRFVIGFNNFMAVKKTTRGNRDVYSFQELQYIFCIYYPVLKEL